MLGLAAVVSLTATVVSAAALEPANAKRCELTVPTLQACASQPSFYSCENTTAIANTCCSPTPGGLQLFTAFWDTYTGRESQGQYLPANSWTLHGLWPDNCDGTYASYCDLSRQYDPAPSPNTTDSGETIKPWTGKPISQFLKKFDQKTLEKYMNTYWVNQGGPNVDFWAHEFSKHATCTSTFDPKCYPNYVEGEEVVDFFKAAIRGFQHFPHYDILAAFGITPSNTTTYSLRDMQAAYKSQTGALPYFGCAKDSAGNKTVLNEIWVNAHILGTPQYGQYKAVDTPARSSCTNATNAIHYFERTPGSEQVPSVYV